IAQLAIEYCNALIDDEDLRTITFPGFPFNANAQDAFPASQQLPFTPLPNRVLGPTQPGSQPSRVAVEAELNQMINGIPGDPSRPGLRNRGTNDATRTKTIAKSVCSAVLGSAAMLVQ